MEREITRRVELSSVVVTSSPYEALQHAHCEPFDIAVVDFTLSDCDPLGFLKALHRINPQLAVIAVAEEITETVTRQVFRHGCREILVKDSSYYRVIPRMVAGLVCRGQISKKDTVGHCQRINATTTCLARNLQEELGSPVDVILETTAQIIDKALGDKTLTDRIGAIRQSALQIKSSLKDLRHRCESGYQPIGFSDNGGSAATRARRKSLV